MKKKLLIVEDEHDLLHMIHMKADFHNYECFLDGTGAKCVDKALKHLPDLILLDINLPERGGGLEIIRKLKEREELSHIPVIIYSNMHKNEIAKKALDLGANAFYSKYEHTSDLFDIIERHIDDAKIDMEETQSFSTPFK